MSPRALIPAGAVVVSPRVAAVLEGLLELDRFRRDVAGRDEELDDVLLGLRYASLLHRAEQVDRFATPANFAANRREPEALWSVGMVAQVAGVSCRAVQRAVAGGRLHATRDDQGRLWIEPEEATRWQIARHRS